MLVQETIAQTAQDTHTEKYDAVVIGGGPGGSTTATFLARKGYKVLVLEREKFPRFHIGESLLPATQRIWEKLNIAEPLQYAGNTFKYAGEIRFGADPQKDEYQFSRAMFSKTPRKVSQERSFGYQVDRAEFDYQLLEHARSEGVDVREECSFKDVIWDEDTQQVCGVRWRTKRGEQFYTPTDCIADCSGRGSVLSKKFKFRKPHPKIKTSSVYGHYKNVQRAEGTNQGYVETYFIEHGWFWFIPLPDNTMSFGVVMNKKGQGWWKGKSPETILHTYLNRYRFLRDRFQEAEQCSSVRILKQLPYLSTHATGKGWILVGDANFFIDPLFSSGVHVAFHSGEKAADAIDYYLKNNYDTTAFKKYERWGRRYSSYLFTTISMFYRLLDHGYAVKSFVTITGQWIGDNFFKRRVVSWFAGYFEKYYWAMYCSWGIILALVGLAWCREKLLGEKPWDLHADYFNDSPLSLAKASSMMTDHPAHPSYRLSHEPGYY